MPNKDEKKHLEKENQKLRDELEKSQETEDLYLEQLKRLKAEFDNYRKRMERQSAENHKTGEKNLALDLLVILDNLQRALDYKDIDFEGLSLIKKEFFNILGGRGLKAMEAEGKKFDHNLHHAIGYCEVGDDKKDGLNVEVIQNGFYWKEEILRPAMVVVGKKKEEAAKPEKKSEKDKEEKKKEEKKGE